MFSPWYHLGSSDPHYFLKIHYMLAAHSLEKGERKPQRKNKIKDEGDGRNKVLTHRDFKM